MLTPELRWAVLRAAVAAKAVPKGCLGLLAYLLARDSTALKAAEASEALGINKGTLRAHLRLLEASGFLATRLTQHGKTLELLVPPSLQDTTVHMVKVCQKDASFSPAVLGAQVAKRGLPEGLRSPNEGYLENEVAKRGLPGNGQVVKIGLPQIQVVKRELPGKGEFLRGMLEALEDGSKPINTDPVCPDNDGIESS